MKPCTTQELFVFSPSSIAPTPQCHETRSKKLSMQIRATQFTQEHRDTHSLIITSRGPHILKINIILSSSLPVKEGWRAVVQNSRETVALIAAVHTHSVRSSQMFSKNQVRPEKLSLLELSQRLYRGKSVKPNTDILLAGATLPHMALPGCTANT